MVKEIRGHLLSFKWAIIPAASAGEGCPWDGDWGRSYALWWAVPLELVGVEVLEGELVTDGGYQDCVGVSWKFGWGCCCWEPLQRNLWTSKKDHTKSKYELTIPLCEMYTKIRSFRCVNFILFIA